eukprot:768643-Hanusia_phi.AAC.1
MQSCWHDTKEQRPSFARLQQDLAQLPTTSPHQRNSTKSMRERLWSYWSKPPVPTSHAANDKEPVKEQAAGLSAAEAFLVHDHVVAVQDRNLRHALVKALQHLKLFPNSQVKEAIDKDGLLPDELKATQEHASAIKDDRLRAALVKALDASATCKPQGSYKWIKGMALGGIAGAIVGPYVLVAGVQAVGFGSSGIVGGSWAAAMMSAEAVASGGGVIAGGTVATLQCIGAAGLGVGGTAAAACAGAALGAGVVGTGLCQEEGEAVVHGGAREKTETGKPDHEPGDVRGENPSNSEYIRG